jgi:outer membrane lipoprotein-sorting protein
MTLLMLFAAAEFVTAKDTPSLEETIHKVQEVYSRQCCFRAAFNQLTVNVSMDLKDRFTGVMYVRKPGLISLDVQSPERQKVVIQGRSYTIYFPDEGNATRGEVPPEVNVEHFFGFFAGIGEMDRNFSIKFPARITDEDEKLIFLELTDKKNPQSTYQIMLGIDADSFTIRRALIYDALGNYNRFDLYDITFLKSIPNDTFEVEPGRLGRMNAPKKTLQEEIGEK